MEDVSCKKALTGDNLYEYLLQACNRYFRQLYSTLIRTLMIKDENEFHPIGENRRHS